MADLVVVRRYARALFQTAAAAGVVDRVEADLAALDEVFSSESKLLAALRAPTLTAAQKSGMLDRLFGESVQPLTRRFLHLLINKQRETLLPHVPSEFRRLANEARNQAPAMVRSAVPLSEDQLQRLTAALQERTGKQITLQTEVDPAMLGGLTVQIGDTVIDGTIRNRLAQLRQLLLGGQAATAESRSLT